MIMIKVRVRIRYKAMTVFQNKYYRNMFQPWHLSPECRRVLFKDFYLKLGKWIQGNELVNLRINFAEPWSGKILVKHY